MVTIRLLPGLPIGRIHQQVRLQLNQDDLEPIEIPVEGAMVGNVTIVGPDYTTATGVLRFGTLAGDEPHERQLWVLMKGEDCRRLRVTETDPPETLEALVGEPIRVGNLTRQSLTIRVVPQGRVVNRLGSQQGEMGRIVMESDSSADARSSSTWLLHWREHHEGPRNESQTKQYSKDRYDSQMHCAVARCHLPTTAVRFRSVGGCIRREADQRPGRNQSLTAGASPKSCCW